MTTRPSDSDYWYYPDAESLPVEFGGKERPPQPPVPEGMETTAEERTAWIENGFLSLWPTDIKRLLRDLDRALAEIARLSEALDGALAADWSSLREALARQEEREACAAIAIEYPWSGIGKTIGLNIAAAIRARPTP